jgi:hypothetical protein
VEIKSLPLGVFTEEEAVEFIVILTDTGVHWHSPADLSRPKKPWSVAEFCMCTQIGYTYKV